MLDETKQNRLADITPLGTVDTEEQISIRLQIQQQKIQLSNLHGKDLGKPVHKSISQWKEEIDKTLLSYNVTRYGISPILYQYSYNNAKLNSNESQAIVLVIPMNYKKMQSVPSLESATEILCAYARTGNAILQLVKLLRDNGIQATGHHPLGDTNQYQHLLFPPHAVEAGLGEKGRTGLFIDYRFGPMVRLGIVTTSLELPIGQPVDKGVNAFCHRCRFCVMHCPPKAINSGKYLDSLRDGIPIEFKINGISCFNYFERHFGCGKCIVKCVLAQPNEIEIAKRLKRIENWYQNWVVSGELKKLHKEITV